MLLNIVSSGGKRKASDSAPPAKKRSKRKHGKRKIITASKIKQQQHQKTKGTPKRTAPDFQSNTKPIDEDVERKIKKQDSIVVDEPQAAEDDGLGDQPQTGSEGLVASRSVATEDKRGEETAADAVEDTASKVRFEDLGLSKEMVQHVTKGLSDGGLGLSFPTMVQEMAVPRFKEKRDVLIRSETGSGKTLTFALPIFDELHQLQPRLSRTNGLYAIVLSPTRELCFQITRVMESLAKRFYWIVVGSLVGGEKRKSEKARLRKGVNVLVATPGRFMDHLNKTESLLRSISKGNLRFFVLDEADRLTDSGFETQVVEAFETIKSASPASATKLRTVLISATLNDRVQALANRSLDNPVKIVVNERPQQCTVGGSNAIQTFQVPTTLTQQYLVCSRKQRLTTLAAFVLKQVRQTGHSSKMVLFVSCRAEVEFLHELMSNIQWPPKQLIEKAKIQVSDVKVYNALGAKWWKLHGSIEQKDRRRTIAEFSRVKGGVLICTDVAARGLDLPSVDWIIQFDPPSEIDDYVHRVGRTARSGRQGSAVLFLCPEETAYLDILKERSMVLKPLNALRVLDSLLCVQNSKRTKHLKGLSARALQSGEAAAELMQIKLEDLVNVEATKVGKAAKPSKNKTEEAVVDLKVLAEDAYISFLRAYAVHSKESKHIFHPKKLHLGHVARAFGLRAEPTGISKNSRERVKEKKKRGKYHSDKRKFTKKADEQMAGFGEFS